MTVHHLTQLSCAKNPAHVYPDPPAEDTTVKDLRKLAEDAGWEVGRSGGAGREVCPDCRIEEIQQAKAGKRTPPAPSRDIPDPNPDNEPSPVAAGKPTARKTT